MLDAITLGVITARGAKHAWRSERMNAIESHVAKPCLRHN